MTRRVYSPLHGVSVEDPRPDGAADVVLDLHAERTRRAAHADRDGWAPVQDAWDEQGVLAGRVRPDQFVARHLYWLLTAIAAIGALIVIASHIE